MSKFKLKSKPYALRHGITVEFELDAKSGALEASWHPVIPQGIVYNSILTPYREARDDFLASLDMPTAVIEI